jgi:formylglycine-generating enzyme required for sulfatase activity
MSNNGATTPLGAGYNLRVVRGGSWNNPSDNARCAIRNRNDPDNRNNNNLGFRVVLSIASRFARGPNGPAAGR